MDAGFEPEEEDYADRRKKEDVSHHRGMKRLQKMGKREDMTSHHHHGMKKDEVRVIKRRGEEVMKRKEEDLILRREEEVMKRKVDDLTLLREEDQMVKRKEPIGIRTEMMDHHHMHKRPFNKVQL